MQSNGFTLLELLGALMLLGILIAIAYPNYQYMIQRVHRQQAALTLMQLSNELTRYHFKNHTYQNALLAMFNIPGTIENSYHISIDEQTQNGYIISAAPLSADADCGTLSLNQLREKNISGSGSVARCW